MSKAGGRICLGLPPLFSIVTFPRQPLPVITPESYPRIKRPPRKLQNLYFMAICRICESRNKYMYIKEIINQILGINSINAHRKSWESGISSAWCGVCCLTIRTYTIFTMNWTRGEYFTNLLDKWREPDLALEAELRSHCAYSTHLFCNNTRMFNKLTNRTLASRFNLLLARPQTHGDLFGDLGPLLQFYTE